MNTWMPCYMMFSFSLVERKIHLETESNSIFLRVYPSKSQCPHWIMSSKKSRPQIELKKRNINGSTQSRYDIERLKRQIKARNLGEQAVSHSEHCHDTPSETVKLIFPKPTCTQILRSWIRTCRHCTAIAGQSLTLGKATAQKNKIKSQQTSLVIREENYCFSKFLNDKIHRQKILWMGLQLNWQSMLRRLQDCSYILIPPLQ